MDEIEQLGTRVAELEALVSQLSSIATYTYVALLSLPHDLRSKDPDFRGSTDKISSILDGIYSTVKQSEQV